MDTFVTKVSARVTANLRHWVVVDVNDLVQVLDDDFGDGCKFVKVKGPSWGHVHVEGDGCQVTHSHLERERKKN